MRSSFILGPMGLIFNFWTYEHAPSKIVEERGQDDINVVVHSEFLANQNRVSFK